MDPVSGRFLVTSNAVRGLRSDWQDDVKF